MAPFIVPIISAIIAALLGAGVAHYFAVRREQNRIKEDRKLDAEREDRERRRVAEAEGRELLGLLRLVHVEVTNNLELFEGMGLHHSYPSSTAEIGVEKLKRGQDSLEAPKLSSDAWEQSRARIAALVEDEERLTHIISGYAALNAFKQRLLNPDTDKLSAQAHQEAVKKARSHQWLAFDACQKETGMFWTWSKGMLVSTPAEDLAEAKDEV